jgi:hypothetical protein
LLSNPQDGELFTKRIERDSEKVVFVLPNFKGLGHEKQFVISIFYAIMATTTF